MRRVLIVGVSPDMQGGIASVLRTYRDSDLATTWNLQFVQTAGQGSRPRKFVVFVVGIIAFAGLCISRRVALAHVHSATGLSFWRKSLVVRTALLAGVPVVLHLHGGNLANFLAGLGPIGRWWARFTLEDATRVVALTPSWRDVVVQAVPDARVAVIPNGVAPHTWSSAENQRDVVLFVGRLEAQKGVYDLLQAFSRLGERHKNLRLILAGTGDSSQVAEMANQLGVRERVELIGWIDEVARDRWMRRARVFVLPSHFEGLPVVVLEAMALGAPVLATRVGGIPDVVADGVTGRLVEVADPIALASVLDSMLDDRAACDAMAARARTLIDENYTIDRVCQAVDALYAEVSQSSKRRPDPTLQERSDRAPRCAE